MAGHTSQGINITIYEAPEYGKAPTGANLVTITSVAKGKNPTATETSGSAYKVKDGDLVVFAERTGMGTALDGQVFLATGAAASTFKLNGGDTTNSGAFENDPKTVGSASYIAKALPAASAVTICLTAVDFSPIQANTINVGSFCDPKATIESSTGSTGSISLSGHVDGGSDGYKILSRMERHGYDTPYILRISLSDNQGDIFAYGTVNNLDWDVPLDGVVGFTCELVTQKNPSHRFTL